MDWENLPALLTVEQARRLLNIGRPTIYQLCHQSGFPTVHIGRALRISRDGLRAWIDTQAGSDSKK